MKSQSDSQYCRQQLVQIMTLQQQQVTAYIDYLDTVKQSVLEHDTDHLDQLLQQTQPGAEIIEQSQQLQAKLLSEQGYEVNQSGLDTCIQQCDQSGQLKTLKKQLHESLGELEKSLFINSYLVRKNQDRVKQSIRILTGHQQSDRSKTYSREGNSANTERSSRSLAQA